MVRWCLQRSTFLEVRLTCLAFQVVILQRLLVFQRIEALKVLFT